MIRCLALFSLVTAGALAEATLVPDPAAAAMAAAPGTEHARLAKLAGDWTVVTTFQFGPGGPAQEFHGKASAKAILGGRFVQVDETAVEFGATFQAVYTRAAAK